MVENEHFQALGQMGTKKAKMAMEEVNENKDGITTDAACSGSATVREVLGSLHDSAD